MQAQQIHIQATGTKASVGSHPIAKLMYYLGAVESLVDFGIPSRLRDYSNYNYLSGSEQGSVVQLALLLSPDLFIEKGIMVEAPQLCEDGYNNEFYTITDTRIGVQVCQSFVIAGKRVHTLKIMAFKMEWMETNYITPMRRISADVNSQRQQNNRQITYTPKVTEVSSSSSYGGGKDDCCCSVQ